MLTGSIANDGSIPFEDRFFRRLETQLADAVPDGRKVEVINVSCEGYNTAQQVRLLEKVGLRYNRRTKFTRSALMEIGSPSGVSNCTYPFMNVYK